MVWDSANSFKSAVAFAIELEVIADRLASEISKRNPLFTISLGYGAGYVAQCLFSTDILDENKAFPPRHAKKYRDFSKEYERLHNERVAYKEFISDVEADVFDEYNFSVALEDEVLKI